MIFIGEASFTIEIFHIFIDDGYTDEGFSAPGIYIRPAYKQIDFNQTLPVYSMLNAFGFTVHNSNEFIEGLIAFCYKYMKSQMIAAKFMAVTQTQDDDFDSLYQ